MACMPAGIVDWHARNMLAEREVAFGGHACDGQARTTRTARQPHDGTLARTSRTCADARKPMDGKLASDTAASSSADSTRQSAVDKLTAEFSSACLSASAPQRADTALYDLRPFDVSDFVEPEEPSPSNKKQRHDVRIARQKQRKRKNMSFA